MIGNNISTVYQTFCKQHWSFREKIEDRLPVGTLKPGKALSDTDPVEALFVTAYRGAREAVSADPSAGRLASPAFASGPDYFVRELGAAVAIKPSYLILASWNEFGSGSDEPSPDESWTIMPNNKYGRRYSEILRSMIIDYKK